MKPVFMILPLSLVAIAGFAQDIARKDFDLFARGEYPASILTGQRSQQTVAGDGRSQARHKNSMRRGAENALARESYDADRPCSAA